MVDVLVGDAGLGKGLGARDAESARGGEILHLADHRRLDRLAGAEQVDRLLREIADNRREILWRARPTRINAPPLSVTRQHCKSGNG
jgi:hypothetical protein